MSALSGTRLDLNNRILDYVKPSGEAVTKPDLCVCGPRTRAERGCECGPRTPERHPSSQRFHDLLRELGELHDKKQADYGRGDDPFSNVRASEEWGIAGWVGAMVRAQDKVRRLQTFAQRGHLVNESVKDSLLDLACYAIIALCLYEETSNG